MNEKLACSLLFHFDLTSWIEYVRLYEAVLPMEFRATSSGDSVNLNLELRIKRREGLSLASTPQRPRIPLLRPNGVCALQTSPRRRRVACLSIQSGGQGRLRIFRHRASSYIAAPRIHSRRNPIRASWRATVGSCNNMCSARNRTRAEWHLKF